MRKLRTPARSGTERGDRITRFRVVMLGVLTINRERIIENVCDQSKIDSMFSQDSDSLRLVPYNHKMKLYV